MPARDSQTTIHSPDLLAPLIHKAVEGLLLLIPVVAVAIIFGWRLKGRAARNGV